MQLQLFHTIMMKAVRLVPASHCRGRLAQRQQPCLCIFPSIGTRHQKDNDSCHLLTLRSRRFFSTEEHDNKSTMRERATQHARNIRQSSAKAARQGAKSAKEMMKQYGPVFVGTYISIYWSFLALLYGGVDSGLVDPLTVIQFIKSNSSDDAPTQSTVEYVVDLMNHYSLTAPYAPYVAKNPHFANLGVAWIGVKFTEPVRLALTVTVVPRLARYFGFVKPEEDHEDEDHHDVTTVEIKPPLINEAPNKKE